LPIVVEDNPFARTAHPSASRRRGGLRPALAIHTQPRGHQGPRERCRHHPAGRVPQPKL